MYMKWASYKSLLFPFHNIYLWSLDHFILSQVSSISICTKQMETVSGLPCMCTHTHRILTEANGKGKVVLFHCFLGNILFLKECLCFLCPSFHPAFSTVISTSLRSAIGLFMIASKLALEVESRVILARNFQGCCLMAHVLLYAAYKYFTNLSSSFFASLPPATQEGENLAG